MGQRIKRTNNLGEQIHVNSNREGKIVLQMIDAAGRFVSAQALGGSALQMNHSVSLVAFTTWARETRVRFARRRW